jgi:hypothetical protein
MTNKFLFQAILILILLSMTGCAVNRATASLTPGTDIKALKSFYIVKQPKDSRGIEKLISVNLIKKGLTATDGPEPQQPVKADAIVTYVDKWMWDITTYLLELTITVRNPINNFPLAVGNSFHTSLTRKSPEEMVDEVLTNILNATEQKTLGENK